MAGFRSTLQRIAKLPVELQLMVWDFYRYTQPPRRHCFSVDGKGHRVYAAINCKTKKIIDNSADRGDGHESPILNETRIRLTGLVQVEMNSECINTIFNTNSRRKRLAKSSSFVYVDLHYDVFCFNNCKYPTLSEPEWFCFLYNPINRMPRPLVPSDHWIFRVRKIALAASKPTYKASNWDFMNILNRMKSLKEVWLVVPPEVEMTLKWGFRQSNTQDSPPRPFDEKCGLVESECYRGYFKNDTRKLQIYAGPTERNMRVDLASYEINPQLKTAVDIVMNWK
ncbi:hypothetical protein F4677DRAFT_463599 [Hypoxylon crocopeplum]|nr:hypothetical protein F4677DRAFT_463599 [Hypoxylon crocopeplum]